MEIVNDPKLTETANTKGLQGDVASLKSHGAPVLATTAPIDESEPVPDMKNMSQATYLALEVSERSVIGNWS